MREVTRSCAVLICLLSMSSSVWPCLQPDGDHYTVASPVELGGLSSFEYVRVLSTTHKSQEYWQKNLASVQQFDKEHPIAGAGNNIAVALVHLGRTAEAIKLLERNEQKFSWKSYSTAANLGTAYELIGNNAKALRWIKEGMARKEDSHYGTEWLHVKILEAKIAIANDKKWLEKNTVLGIDWNTIGLDLSKVSVTGHDGKIYDAAAIQKALEYQLHERTEFVKPPEPIVGQLLVDLSKLVHVSISPEHGTPTTDSRCRDSDDADHIESKPSLRRRSVRGVPFACDPSHLETEEGQHQATFSLINRPWLTRPVGGTHA